MSARSRPTRTTARVFVEFMRRTFPRAVGREHLVKTCLYTLPPDRDFVLDRLPGHDRVLLAVGAGHAVQVRDADRRGSSPSSRSAERRRTTSRSSAPTATSSATSTHRARGTTDRQCSSGTPAPRRTASASSPRGAARARRASARGDASASARSRVPAPSRAASPRSDASSRQRFGLTGGWLFAPHDARGCSLAAFALGGEDLLGERPRERIVGRRARAAGWRCADRPGRAPPAPPPGARRRAPPACADTSVVPCASSPLRPRPSGVKARAPAHGGVPPRRPSPAARRALRALARGRRARAPAPRGRGCPRGRRRRSAGGTRRSGRAARDARSRSSRPCRTACGSRCA